jgi:ABC-type multidrug transport system permease subunit
VRFTWACTIKELRRNRRDPLAIGMWLGIPALISLLLVLVFGRGQVTPKGTLLVADEDSSLVSSLLAGAFGQGRLGEMLTVEKVTHEDGQARINRGDGSAVLVIPKGFGDAILNSRPSRLKLVTNPSQSILPSIVEETVSVLLEGVFYMQALIGDRLQTFSTENTPPLEQVLKTSTAFYNVGTSVGKYLNPRLIDLETEVVESKGAATINIAAAFVPTFLFMAFLFLSMGFSEEMWKERRQGTVRRLLTTPGRMEAFLLGRVLAVVALLLFASIAGLWIGQFAMAVPAGRVVTAILFAVPAGVTLYLLLQLLVLSVPTERAAHTVSNMVMMPLAMLGGTFFPFEVMPGWMASIGRWTPNGWAVTQLGAILGGRLGPVQAGQAAGYILLLAALAFLLISWRLRRWSAV